MSTILGWCSNNCCLTSSDHITPEDVIPRRLARFHLPGFVSSALRMGLPKASPTIDIKLIPSRSIESRSSEASKLRLSSVTIEPPKFMTESPGKFPVPCICGQAGQNLGPGPGISRSVTSPSSGIGFARAPASTTARSSCRHMTPLGMPVVPPVYNIMRSSPLLPQVGESRWAPASATCSYSTAQSGQGPLPSSTQSQTLILGSEPRIVLMSSLKVPWNTTAPASALSHRYLSSSAV